MPIERFFSDANLERGSQLHLEGQEFHHLAHVTRIKVGEVVELVNGRGALAEAVVQKIDKKGASIVVQSITQAPPQEFELVLAQAMPRMNRFDFILEKGTELGMTQLWIFPGSLSERRELTDHQFERLKLITIAAMKQCGRLYLPQLIVKPSITVWQSLDYPGFYGDVEPAAPPFHSVWKEKSGKGILFFIGPESGFTEKETIALQKLGAKGVKLNVNILRTDTAALAALSLVAQTLI